MNTKEKSKKVTKPKPKKGKAKNNILTSEKELKNYGI